MIGSSTTQDPRILRNLQVMQADPKMVGQIGAYLRDIEHVNPDDYASNPNMGQTLMRGAGLAGRAVTQGLGGVQDLNPFGAPQRIGNQVAGIQQPPLGPSSADQMGLPQPQTPGERMGVAAGENATIAAATGGGAGMMAVGAGAGLAGQGVAEAGGGPLAQMAASAAVGMGLPVIGIALAGATRAALAGSAAKREAARQSLALVQAGDPNAPVTLGQVTKGGLGRILDAGLRQVPGANVAIKGALDDQSAGLGQRTQGIASRIGPGGTPITVGRTVQKGIENGFVPRFRATANQLFGAVDTYVPPGSPVMLSSTAKLMAEQNELAASAQPLGDLLASPFMQKWGAALAETSEKMPGGVPFNVVKQLRSRLGDVLSGAEMVADVNLRDVKRLYGSLTEDMTRTVADVGGPEGMKVWGRASNYWKAGTERLENVLQPLVDKKTPEVAFNALMSGSKDGGTVLRSTMRSLHPEERRVIASAVIGRLGTAEASAQNAAGDVFSPDRFLTKWNQLSPVAKGALFDGIDPRASKDLDALSKAMELVRRANKTMPNPAGTSSNVAFFSILSALGAGAGAMAGGGATSAMTGAAGTLAAVGASQQLAKRVFTSPKMIRWLVGTTKIPFGMLAQQTAILAKDSQKWGPEDRDLAQEALGALGGIDWSQLFISNAVSDATGQR